MSETARPDPDPHTALETCLADLADNKPADAVLVRLRAIEPALPGDAIVRANFLRARAIATNRLGFAGEALGDLHEARRLLEGGEHPKEIAAVFQAIATVYSWRGESREAALALLRVVAEASGDALAVALALIEGGRLQMEIGRPADAQALLTRALELGKALLPKREFQRAWVNRLQASVAAGQIDRARAQLAGMAEALAQAPGRLFLLAHLEASRVAVESGDLAAAAAALDQARTFAPDGDDAFERIEIAEAEAELALARGETGKAAALLGAVISRYADDDLAAREVRARLIHAKALDALNRTSEAERTLAAALAPCAGTRAYRICRCGPLAPDDGSRRRAQRGRACNRHGSRPGAPLRAPARTRLRRVRQGFPRLRSGARHRGRDQARPARRTSRSRDPRAIVAGRAHRDRRRIAARSSRHRARVRFAQR